MSPTLEDAISFLKANEVEKGQQVLLQLLSDDPKNDLAWKYLIESYPDLDLQIKLAEEYFNLSGGDAKATQSLLRYTRIKNERYVRQEADDEAWLSKLKWLSKIKLFEKITWDKTFLVKVILGLLAFIVLSNAILIGTSISGAVTAGAARRDFERLSRVYSEQLQKTSKAETQFNDLTAVYQVLSADYEVLRGQLLECQARLAPTP
ncbi:MAG: hypothetical protein JXR32_10810 [Anaerolineaceae bacterium]|nr:hypothetical protein [Anaerolineaceae bacterium]